MPALDAVRDKGAFVAASGLRGRIVLTLDG